MCHGAWLGLGTSEHGLAQGVLHTLRHYVLTSIRLRARGREKNRGSVVALHFKNRGRKYDDSLLRESLDHLGKTPTRRARNVVASESTFWARQMHRVDFVTSLSTDPINGLLFQSLHVHG